MEDGDRALDSLCSTMISGERQRSGVELRTSEVFSRKIGFLRCRSYGGELMKLTSALGEEREEKKKYFDLTVKERALNGG